MKGNGKAKGKGNGKAKKPAEMDDERTMAGVFRDFLTKGLNVISFKRIPFSELRVDLAYQRPEVAEYKFAEMMQEFSGEAFGAVLVGVREDGSTWVVDAQQRVGALRRMIDLVARYYTKLDPVLPCLVFKSAGATHEAAVYYLINGKRTPLKPHETFKAAVLAGKEIHVAINKFLATMRLSIGAPSSKSPNMIGFTNVLVRTWIDNEKACKTALRIQRAIVGPNGVMVRAIHKGLWWVIDNKGGFTSADIVKLRAMGKEAICDVISARAGKGERAHTSTCGEAILSILRAHESPRRSRAAAAAAVVVAGI